jgi:hypothetical protein
MAGGISIAAVTIMSFVSAPGTTAADPDVQHI